MTNAWYPIKVIFDYTLHGERRRGDTLVMNSTPVGPSQARALALAQRMLAPAIEKRYRVREVVITELVDVVLLPDDGNPERWEINE